ncbi:hypothetical protein QVD17_17157 [Tagetes erecta]|uniref:Uncharacterized protein n=1 Tax=Tagetes erecta TaxID=13708 RepID=A0AAD8KRS7_TARER|nr:hypothetical protein QVD17_17157 [Tagetes erecta]
MFKLDYILVITITCVGVCVVGLMGLLWTRGYVSEDPIVSRTLNTTKNRLESSFDNLLLTRPISPIITTCNGSLIWKWRWKRARLTDQEVVELNQLFGMLLFVAPSQTGDAWKWINMDCADFRAGHLKRIIQIKCSNAAYCSYVCHSVINYSVVKIENF